MIAPLALLSLASVAAAHIDIVYPQGSWTHTEDQQDTGAVCGGGTRVSSFAWGTENSFVAVAGDAGELGQCSRVRSTGALADEEASRSHHSPRQQQQHDRYDRAHQRRELREFFLTRVRSEV